MSETRFDVVVVGGGPAGLSAALMLGRGCRKVLLCDGGPRRNLRAEAIHGFVSRDGTPPDTFRQISREQLTPYDVTVRDALVTELTGELDAFQLTLATGEKMSARRVLLALGMVDQMLDLPGFASLWGRSIFVCPYCHGWELRAQPWGHLAMSAAELPHARFLSNWAPSLTVFTRGAFAVSDEERAQLAGLRLEERPIRALLGEERLEAVELVDGERVPVSALFARPPQRQTPLVAGLGLDLDEHGFVRVSPQAETSRKGIHAAGDLTTMMQSAIMAAGAGTMAAAFINHLLVMGPEAHWGPKR